jgi:hypothetical protein
MISNTSIGHYGRLGNQIFQYALLKVVGIKNNYEVVLPQDNETNVMIGRYNPSDNKVDTYKLDLYECFKINDKKVPINQITTHTTYNEKHMHFDPEVFNIKDGTNFHGYYQCADYFYQYEDQLKKSLSFNDNIEQICVRYINQIKNIKNVKNITTVHIRRGDGVVDQGKYQVLLSIDYYKNLISKIRSDNNIFLIISDDINWCKEQFDENDIVFSQVSTMPTSISKHLIDFCLLSKGDSIVMANSSYSWWAAWLSEAQNIYCPDKWWGSLNSHFNETNLRHKKWRLIDAK